MIEQILSRLNSIPSDKVFHFAGGLLFSLLCATAQADAWTGQDKTQHAAVGAIIGAAVTSYTANPVNGCVAAATAGALKELYDYRHPLTHTTSFKDFAVTAAFGCASAYTTSWIITPTEIRYTFRF